MRKYRFTLILINATALSTLMMVVTTTTAESSGGPKIKNDTQPSSTQLTSLNLAEVQGQRSSTVIKTTTNRSANMEEGAASRPQNASFEPTNGTLFATNGNDEPTGISDKDIVLIVICSAVLLVICLVGVALLAKCHCGKIRRDDTRARYQGVLQRDSSANSPMEEQTTITLTNKDNDAHGHTNMFAQIDEIDEVESCPPSPAGTGKHLRRISNTRRSSQEPSEFETKPLLTYTEATPTSRNKVIKEPSRTTTHEDGRARDDDEEKLPNAPPVAEIRVEIVPSPSRRSVEVERRMYCRTGLSQSDYSLSSFTSVNPSYHYGNQVGYLGGYYGYPSEVLVIDLGSPADYYADVDSMLLLPPSASDHAIFPSQESDLDISVRAAKDSGSDDVTIDGTSMIGDISGIGGGVIGVPSLMAMDSGSDPSLDRLIIADDAYTNECLPEDATSEDKNKLVTDVSSEELKTDSSGLEPPSMTSLSNAEGVPSIKIFDDDDNDDDDNDNGVIPRSDTAENVTEMKS